ncbi:MAG: hypothetical protein AAF709_24710 [Pseudomonadota bacterium]
MQITQDQQCNLADLASFNFTKQDLMEFPHDETNFRPRGSGSGHLFPRDIAKGEIPLRTLANMDIEYYEGELFAAGIDHDNFTSSLRRLAYPFDGSQGITNVERCHMNHDQN